MKSRGKFISKFIAIVILVVSFFTILISAIGIFGYFSTEAYIYSGNEYRSRIVKRYLYEDVWQIGRLVESSVYDEDSAMDKSMFEEIVLSMYNDSNIILTVRENGKEILQLNQNEEELVRSITSNYEFKNGISVEYEMSVMKNLRNSDKYVQIVNLVDIAYSLRYWIYPILIIGMIAFVSVVYYFKKTKTTNKLNWIDHIPLEILLFTYLFIYIEVLTRYSYRALEMWFSVFILIIGFFMGLATLNNRFSNKVLLKNTLVYKAYKLFQYFTKNVGVFWKVFIVMGLMFTIDIWIIINFRYNYFLMFIVLLGKNVTVSYFVLKHFVDLKNIQIGTEVIAYGNLDFKFNSDSYQEPLKSLTTHLNQISNAAANSVDKQIKSERMKTELITNVSHDIKTPITSIINYVNLLSETTDQNEINEYTEVLMRQSERLKNLVENLIEASKLSTGNITIKKEPTDIKVLINQIIGEYSDKLEQKQLELVFNSLDQKYTILGDGQQLSRMFDNLLNNAYQYSHENTRIYIDLTENKSYYIVTIKNVSKQALNVEPNELIERFTRGDSSRNTEGSGLGLSIANSIADLHNGEFVIQIDGDLFKVVIEFLKEG